MLARVLQHPVQASILSSGVKQDRTKTALSMWKKYCVALHGKYVVTLGVVFEE